MVWHEAEIVSNKSTSKCVLFPYTMVISNVIYSLIPFLYTKKIPPPTPKVVEYHWKKLVPVHVNAAINHDFVTFSWIDKLQLVTKKLQCATCWSLFWIISCVGKPYRFTPDFPKAWIQINVSSQKPSKYQYWIKMIHFFSLK